MGQHHSKDESLYQQVNCGNIQGIKSLRSDGAGLEWVDKEGKTPLILACMNAELYNVAKTLIDLGANVNAYRPGRHAGTPLHHAAKRGLESTIRLLLSHGANALLINDDCQTPLDIAREKGFGNVVRAIESHICLFSGWLRELNGMGLGFLQSLAPKLLSKKVWVVILPCGARNLLTPIKLELAIYTSSQDAKPRSVISLWKANLEEPKLNQPDPSVQIVESTTISRGRRRKRRDLPQTLRQTRTKFGPGNEGDRQQLQLFCDACKGIPRATPPPPLVQATAPPRQEHDDLDLAMAMSASMQTPSYNPNSNSEASTSTNWNNNNIPASIPTAPPLMDEINENGPIHYPSIDSNPINPSSSQVVIGNMDGVKDETKVDGESSSCVICLDAPVEGACVPCGHMCGCMSCLDEVKAKKWGCPVCRAKINQIIRVYAV